MYHISSSFYPTWKKLRPPEFVTFLKKISVDYQTSTGDHRIGTKNSSLGKRWLLYENYYDLMTVRPVH